MEKKTVVGLFKLLTAIYPSVFPLIFFPCLLVEFFVFPLLSLICRHPPSPGSWKLRENDGVTTFP